MSLHALARLRNGRPIRAAKGPLAIQRKPVRRVEDQAIPGSGYNITRRTRWLWTGMLPSARSTHRLERARA